MSWWRDVLRQCLFMCLFIIPIPIGAYTIHNGSSAVVAAVSFLVLSLGVPWVYVGMEEATFGPRQWRITRLVFTLIWVIALLCGAIGWLELDEWWKAAYIWDWPTIGRDIVFIVGMYAFVAVTMILSCRISVLMKEGKP